MYVVTREEILRQAAEARTLRERNKLLTWAEEMRRFDLMMQGMCPFIVTERCSPCPKG